MFGTLSHLNMSHCFAPPALLINVFVFLLIAIGVTVCHQRQQGEAVEDTCRQNGAADASQHW